LVFGFWFLGFGFLGLTVKSFLDVGKLSQVWVVNTQINQLKWPLLRILKIEFLNQKIEFSQSKFSVCAAAVSRPSSQGLSNTIPFCKRGSLT